jgi:hypothetical protein
MLMMGAEMLYDGGVPSCYVTAGMHGDHLSMEVDAYH